MVVMLLAVEKYLMTEIPIQFPKLTKQIMVLVRPVDVNVGLVCLLQTYCTSCESVLKSTYSSDRLGGSTCCDTFGDICHHGHGSGKLWSGEAGTSSRHERSNWKDMKYAKEIAYTNMVATASVIDEAV